jgi:hypothetical protein
MACASFQPNTVDRSRHSLGGDNVVVADQGASSTEDAQVVNAALSTYKQVLQCVQEIATSQPLQDLDPKLKETLASDPCWSAAANGKPASGGLPAVGNFFMLVFKYMADHANSDNQIQIAQAVNMVCQNNMLDSVTSEAMSNLSSTESQVSSEESSASKTLELGLAIGLAATVLTAGVGAGIGGAVAGVAGTFATTTAVTVGTTVASVGIAATTAATMGVYNNETSSASGDMTEMQAFMAVNSASSGNVSNVVKEDQQIQQSELSDVQSTQSLEVTMVQAETQVFSLGNF